MGWEACSGPLLESLLVLDCLLVGFLALGILTLTHAAEEERKPDRV